MPVSNTNQNIASGSRADYLDALRGELATALKRGEQGIPQLSVNIQFYRMTASRTGERGTTVEVLEAAMRDFKNASPKSQSATVQH
jgi:hypothetical protein